MGTIGNVSYWKPDKLKHFEFLICLVPTHATDYFHLNVGLATSYLSSPKDLTMPMKEDQQMHVVQICPMVEGLSSKPY